MTIAELFKDVAAPDGVKETAILIDVFMLSLRRGIMTADISPEERQKLQEAVAGVLAFHTAATLNPEYDTDYEAMTPEAQAEIDAGVKEVAASMMGDYFDNAENTPCPTAH